MRNNKARHETLTHCLAVPINCVLFEAFHDEIERCLRVLLSAVIAVRRLASDWSSWNGDIPQSVLEMCVFILELLFPFLREELAGTSE
jgi:hypothetical protein